MAGDLLINAKRPPRIHVKESEFTKVVTEPNCKANRNDNFISPAPIAPLATLLINRYIKRFKQLNNQLFKFGSNKMNIKTKSIFLIK